MNPRAQHVQALDNYCLLVTFDNNEQRKFDATQLFQYKMYEPIRNKHLFSLAKADGMCVYWNDDIDICPDILYQQSVRV
jgi:hypothetical protein